MARHVTVLNRYNIYFRMDRMNAQLAFLAARSDFLDERMKCMEKSNADIQKCISLLKSRDAHMEARLSNEVEEPLGVFLDALDTGKASS